MNIKPLVFASKKATMAALGAAVITFVMTVLPLLYPDVPEEVWQSLANLLTQLFSLYLIGQSGVDIVEGLQHKQVVPETGNVAPEPIDEHDTP